MALQPDRRIAFLALRDPVGPFVPRTITVQDVADLRGQAMPAQTRADRDHGRRSRRRRLGSGAARRWNAGSVRERPPVLPVPRRRRRDPLDRHQLEERGRRRQYVGLRLRSPSVLAVDPETEESRDLRFSVARNGQRLNVDIVMLGRGTLAGTNARRGRRAAEDTAVRVTSLTDQSVYGATTDADGRFTVARIPVGNIFVETVNPTANAQIAISENIPFAGATTDARLRPADGGSPKQIVVKRGQVTGHVLRSTGDESAGRPADHRLLPGLSQPGVGCPGVSREANARWRSPRPTPTGRSASPGCRPAACACPASIRPRFEEGEASLQLAADGIGNVNIVISGGLGNGQGRRARRVRRRRRRRAGRRRTDAGRRPMRRVTSRCPTCRSAGARSSR